MGAVLVADIARDQQGADFAAAKAGRGGLRLAGLIAQVSFNDAWVGFAEQARNVGLPIGAYWWPTFSANPEGEASVACQRRAAGQMVGPLWLDLEEQNVGDLTDWVRRFVAAAATQGVQVGIYSTFYYLQSHLSGGLNGAPFWMAGGSLYDVTDPNPPNPDPNCILWQYTQYGRLPGVNGNIDLNVTDESNLAAIFGGTPDPTTEDGEGDMAFSKQAQDYMDMQFESVRQLTADRANALINADNDIRNDIKTNDNTNANDMKAGLMVGVAHILDALQPLQQLALVSHVAEVSTLAGFPPGTPAADINKLAGVTGKAVGK